MPSPRPLLALATLAAAVFWGGSAHAFCRTKACDTTPSYGDIWDEAPPPTECVKNAQGCYLQGTPLYWPSNCITYTVQRDGSASSGVDAEAARAVIQEAFEKWAWVDCGGGEIPSVQIISHGEVACDRAEYNAEGPNQNVFVFRDAEWPYHNAIDALALTTLTFNVETAEIYDADVELNSHDGTFTITDEPIDIKADFSSVVTHEAGHFLGLSHSSDSTAVMRGTGYQMGTMELRVLTDDDILGVCQMFPPGHPISGSCEPRHGFASECGSTVKKEDEGCTASGRPARTPGSFLVVAAGAFLFAFRRRRARRR